MVGRNVAALVEIPRQVRTGRNWLVPEQARMHLGDGAEAGLAAVYRMPKLSVMRQGDLIGLRWQDVDLDADRLRVTRALDRAGDWSG